MLQIRPERPGDLSGIRLVNDQAFGQPDEAAVVDTLRGTVESFISLVAERGGPIVGHILFAPVTIESDQGATRAMALGPMGVLPEYQRQGIGSELVRASLEECRRIGQYVVFVVGHSEYYPRFGFEPARPKGLTCQWDVPDDVFMVAELQAGALSGRCGMVRYAPAFGEA